MQMSFLDGACAPYVVHDVVRQPHDQQIGVLDGHWLKQAGTRRISNGRGGFLHDLFFHPRHP